MPDILMGCDYFRNTMVDNTDIGGRKQAPETSECCSGQSLSNTCTFSAKTKRRTQNEENW